MNSIKTKISDFIDYRRFLAAAVEELREKGIFSHRKFNQACGFSSPNFIQLVIQGKRNLSAKAGRKIGETLGLQREDISFFVKMIEANNEPDPVTKTTLLQSLLKNPAYAQRHKLSVEQLNYYSRWYNIPLRELLQSHPEMSPKKLAETLIPQISEGEVQESLKAMAKLGLIEKGERGWKVLHPNLATLNEIFHQGIRHYHHSMIQLAQESIERFPGTAREISSVTLQMTEEEFLFLREKIREFKKETLAAETRQSSSRIYQFNFQLFPISKGTEEGNP